MLKLFKIVILVILVTASSLGAVAQIENYKEVTLNGRPAKLNVNTGIITFNDGTVAKSKTAIKIKDSVRASNTIINKNPIPLDSKQDTVIKISEVKLSTIEVDNNTSSRADLNLVILDTIRDSINTNFPKTLKRGAYSPDSTVTVSPQNDSIKHDTPNGHLVKHGETLYTISKLYNTTLGALKKANHLKTTLIKPGQFLQIGTDDSYDEDKNLVWIVTKGDTLFNIAKRNGTTVANIKFLNELENNLIIIGQKLQLK